MEDQEQKDPVVDIKARLDSLEKEKAEMAAKAAEAAASAQRSASAIERVEGQISLIASAAAQSAPASQSEGPEPTDILNDPEKVIQHQFEKRIAPLRAASIENAVQVQRDIVSLKRKEDWEEFGPAVEAAIVHGRITKEQLSQPGTYENLLDFVKSKNVEKIVEKRVQAEVAKFQADAAKSAGGGASSQVKASDIPAPRVEMTAEEKIVAAKFGLTEKDYVDSASSVTFDGVLYRGEVR